MSRSIETQTFGVDPNFVWLFRVSIWILAAFALFFIVLPFLPESETSTNASAVIILSAVGVLLFGSGAIYSVRLLKQLPFSSITVDSDGLWLSHRTKDNGLVRWSSIADIQERQILQRLDVKNQTGDLLLKVEYQLMGFDTLRALIVDYLRSIEHPLIKPVTLSKPMQYHVFNIACLIGFSGLGLKVGPMDPWVGYGGVALLVGGCGYEYLSTACQVTIGSGHLDIRYPCWNRRYSYLEIESVQLGDLFIEGARHQEIVVFLKAVRRPIKLKYLGVDSTKLFQIISSQKMRYA